MRLGRFLGEILRRAGGGPGLSVATAALAIALSSGHADAQTDEGQITIVVSDASSKAPIPLARVLLEGPVIASELTTMSGRVVFQDVPSGLYTARVLKGGYQTITTQEFEVASDQAVTVRVSLAQQSGPRSLGTIVVTSNVDISTTSISQDSPIRTLSSSLNDALNKVAGVSVDTDTTANDAPETISLEGHDPSQTQVLLDGIPLNAPGTAGDLRFISSDLFGGVAVNFNPVAGALGGSVNYRTLEPTRTWVTGLSQTFGSQGGAVTNLSVQGSAGSLGIAYVHAIRGSNNLLAGQKFADTSGLDYVHAGANQTQGDLLTLRASIAGTQSISGTFISSNGYNDALCTVDTGPLPCGYGPGNYNSRHFALAALSDAAFVGATSLQLSFFGTQSRADRDLLNRYVAGVPSPFGQQLTGSTRGASLSAELPSRERHTISFQAVTSSANQRSTGLGSEAAIFGSAQGTSSYSSFSVLDTIRSNDRLTLGDSIGVSRANHFGASLLAGVNARWNPTSRDAFVGSIDVGNNGAGPPRFGVLTDPAGLQFNCPSGTAYGSGPGDEPGAQTAFDARTTYRHAWPAVGVVSVSVYRQVQHDTLLNALVNASALPPGYFPPGYFQEVGQVFASPGGCDAPAGTVFPPANLYLNLPVSGVTMVYEGMQLTGDVNLGHALAAEPFYVTQVVKPLTSDPRLTNIDSDIIAGAQMPGIPLHQAGITFDYRAFNSPLELLADARYTSPDNRNYLPGYVVADAGLAYDFTHGRLTVSESNVFNKFGYEFASSTYAVGPPTVGAGPLAVIARPLAPRQINVTYAVKIGYGQTAAQAAQWQSGTREVAQGGPQTPGGPRGGRGFFFGALREGFPQTPPASPFAPDTTRPSCTAAAAQAAGTILGAMKAYVAALEAAKTPSGYPSAPPADMPDVPGFTPAYHPAGGSYAVTFMPQTLDALRSVLSCAQIHIGTQEQAQAARLYVPAGSSFFRNPLTYMPSVGLYIVRHPPAAGQEQFRVYRLPATPPAQPLAVVPSDRCTSDLKPVAEQLLTSLSQYVATKTAGGASPPPPAGWTVTVHSAPKGWWLELQPQPLAGIPALINCARVSAGTESEITAAGYGAARLPALNFTPALGLYIERNPGAEGGSAGAHGGGGGDRSQTPPHSRH
jgi:hypothetical protein